MRFYPRIFGTIHRYDHKTQAAEIARLGNLDIDAENACIKTLEDELAALKGERQAGDYINPMGRLEAMKQNQQPATPATLGVLGNAEYLTSKSQTETEKERITQLENEIAALTGDVKQAQKIGRGKEYAALLPFKVYTKI